MGRMMKVKMIKVMDKRKRKGIIMSMGMKMTMVTVRRRIMIFINHLTMTLFNKKNNLCKI